MAEFTEKEKTDTRNKAVIGSDLIQATVGTASILGTRKSNTAEAVGMDGEKHTYTKEYSTDMAKSPSGLDAGAWVEKGPEDKKVLEITFPGYPGLTANAQQTASMHAVGDKKLYPQTLEVKDFFDKAIDAAGGKDKISGINISSHSMGAANATVAVLLAQMKDIPVSSVQIDPVGASLAAEKIEEALKDPKSELYKQLVTDTGVPADKVISMLKENTKDSSPNTSSIVTVTIDEQRIAHTSKSAALESGLSRAENQAIAMTGKTKDGTIRTPIDAQKEADGNAPTGSRLYVPMNKENKRGIDPDPTHRLGNAEGALREGRALMNEHEQIVMAFKFGDAAKEFASSLWNQTIQSGDGNTRTDPGLNQTAPAQQQEARGK